MKCEVNYISCNSNETPSIADWGKNNLICYGACNSVMIYDPNHGSGGKVIQTLAGHTKRVNSVKWIKGVDSELETEIVSGSADSTVRVWSFDNFVINSQPLLGHTTHINMVNGIYKESQRKSAIVISTSLDTSVIVYFRLNPGDNFSLHHTIDFNYDVGLSIGFSFLPFCEEILLAIAFTNSKIILYRENEENNSNFEPVAELEGHEDWVRGLAFTKDGDDLLLASCSQDCYIRLWRITSRTITKHNENFQYNNIPQIKTKSQSFNIYLESILTGHEGWVYSVCWNPNNLQLLSASFDKTMIIWEYDRNIELWVEKVRVGEVGGNTLGFYGGLFSPNADQILAHSYHGAFHIWKHYKELEEWKPCVTVGGHFAEVVDCDWEPKGEFLYSCGVDQTTRIHAPWRKEGEKVTWHEIARPQVHGYDMSSLAVISRYKFASSAEEKIIRIFEAPANFVDNFRRLCQIQEDNEGDKILQGGEQGPTGASVPSLGLSNKAVFTEDNIEQAAAVDKRNNYPEESLFVATTLTEPPTEETLLQNTLWPETEKLYGHGYEVYCLAASPDQKYLASACKSTRSEHAVVLIWNTTNWQQLQKLMSHNLTVVQLQFSPDSRHLLSVSRDRRWTLFSKKESSLFERVATTDKNLGVHTRIIWTCAWSHDSKYFATGSRDGKLVIWTIRSGKEITTVLGECEQAAIPLEFTESVTAVAFAPGLIQSNYLIAIGFESGSIKLFLFDSKESKEAFSVMDGEAHHLAVQKLVFRPVFGEAGSATTNTNILQLASCSADHSVRVYDINL